MRTWQFYAVLGGGLVAWSSLIGTGSYFLGRAHQATACEKQKTESAGEAIDEQNADAAGQKEGGAEIAGDFIDEAARLRRAIEGINYARVDDGDACLDADDGQRMHDAYDEIFEKGLHP